MKKTKFVYLYEDNFIELLFTIRVLLTKKKIPYDIQAEETYQNTLFDNPFKMKKNDNSNEIKIWIQKTNQEIISIAKDIYLSTHPKKELILYYFLKNALKYQETILGRRNLKCVNEALKISHYVHQETHKMKGFLRFQELENHVLFAKMEPENNIIYALCKHFSKRFANENFIIYDIKRQIYGIYVAKKLYFIKGKEINVFMTQEEKNIEELWQTFFNTIGIEERKNLKCQRNFMPKKYWKHIVEMEGKL